MTLRIRIDGQSYEVPRGRTLLQALDDIGVLMREVEIPHFCWHPKLSVDGSCRLCQVEVEGKPKLQIACDTLVEQGMVVRTTTERVRRARSVVMELLLLDHPLDCPICDKAGECALQDHAFAYGPPHARTREPRRPGRKRVALGPTIVFDEERCILCRRCVRFCREVPGTGELLVTGRGDRSRIATLPDRPLDDPYAMNVADICPVGALTTRDFRFKARVWDLEQKPGLCTGCSRGCNLWVGVARGQVQRYVPRRNDRVNGTWICDAGRLSHHEISAPHRIPEASIRDDEGRLQPAPLGEAIAAAAARVRDALDREGPEHIAAFASPHATNEDLDALRHLLDALGVTRAAAAVVLGEGDEILLRPERAANARGARDRGFGDPAPVLDAIREGAVRVLLVMGHDLLAPSFLGSAAPLAALETVILLDTHRSALERVAQVVIPGLHLAEKGGSITNCEGFTQSVPAALAPAFEALPEARVLEALTLALGLPPRRAAA